MAVTAKCTFFLTYKTAGVSFSLFNNPNSLAALTLAGVDGKSAIDRVWESYLPLLGVGVDAPYVRISDVLQAGDTEFYDKVWYTITPGASFGTPALPNAGNVSPKARYVIPVIPDAPDFYDTSALISLSASATQKGRLFMRFQPDSIVKYPAGLNPPQNWIDAFAVFIQVLKTGQWCIRALADETSQPKHEIQTISRTASGDNVTVASYDTLAYPPKSLVRISRSSVNTYNGIFVVDTLVDGKVTLRNTAGTSTGKLSSGGFIRLRQYTYPVITAGTYRRVSRRKAGRPFASPVGKAPKK